MTAALPAGSALEVLAAFFRLGLTSFGGPIAHLGYFRREFVDRRRWLDDAGFTDLVALCQFLPGPASSQVGIAIGFGRAGWAGSIAAWVGFTLPSALALIALAHGVGAWSGPAREGALHGLELAAVAVVAQAVWQMSRSLCPDAWRRGIALAAVLLAWGLPSASGQLAAIVVGAALGRAAPSAGSPPLSPPPLSPSPSPSPSPFLSPSPSLRPARVPGRRTGAALLGVFVALLVLLPLATATTASAMAPGLAQLAASAAVFYRAGALVFGGGHVVLPLLQASLVPTGIVAGDVFAAGYGAAQAVPGPLFSFAAYLGAVMPHPLGGWGGAGVALVAVFVPGYLLVVGALPFWQALRRREDARRALNGVDAAVVGLLAAALYDPLVTGAVRTPADVGVVLAGFGLLARRRVPPLVVVGLAAAAGVLMAR